ncbi:MAG: MFS transporter [Novosphingobium sp.]|nr:MFS transporter [Novosphingobium sp.]MBX9642635.1 peptide MFS transporter [Novosphingobium sp.]
MKSVNNRLTAMVSGQPKGVFFLAGTELWERFSFYGMASLLTLYMVNQLLLPEFAQHVWGLAGLRSGAEAVFGPLSNTDLASLIAGLYLGLVYFTPIVGGWIADRWLGAKRTVTIGVVLMSAGHLAMAFDQLFVIALALLITGSGALKGNISYQVGTLYPPGELSQRDRGFAIFSTGINIGAVAGPLTIGAIKEIYGWHAGFTAAGLMMLAALVIYLAGQKHLPETPPRKRKDPDTKPLTPAERRKVWALILIITMTIPAEITYPMVWTIGYVWVQKWVNLGGVPATWFGALDSLGAILAAPVLIGLWLRQARKGSEPGGVAKIAIGTALTGVGALILAAGSLTQTGENTVGIGWAIGGWLVMGLAWMYYWPTTLSLVSRVAPASVAATMVGGAFISPFLAHTLAGMVGTRFDNMTPAAFWAMDASIAFVGALLLFAVNKPLSRALEAEPD